MMHAPTPCPQTTLVPVDAVLPDVFRWTDTCNVYVIRDGEAALLIDLGDGSVLEHLPEIGVTRVEWVLFTHHHREQCQGAARLTEMRAQLAGPESERAFFEQPVQFRKMVPLLGDAFSVYGSSYVRPPVEAIPLDRGFAKMDEFVWHGRVFRCVETRGNSPGGMTYLLQHEGEWVAFSGDVLLDGAHMHTWFDTEWDYGFAAGIYALYQSAALLERFTPAMLLPAHGAMIADPLAQLAEYKVKLQRLEGLYLRGYGVSTFGASYQDKVSTPTAVPDIWQLSPHLFKFKAPDFYPNFTLLLADNGHALVVDCGLFNKTALDHSLGLMRERLGLRAIDAVIITHMHGDHFLEAPHLRETYGAEIWTLDCIADKCARPERYDYVAPIQSYGAGVDAVPIDRTLHDGETFDWQGYRFTVDWMPGQTEFGLCLHGEIDGRLVAFTGDNLFADPDDPRQDGHEAVVAHNSAILEEGYLYAADYLQRLAPDILIGGHSYVMDHPAGLIARFGAWAHAMRAAFQDLCPLDDYRYWFDPFWVRADPYRVTLTPGQPTEVTLHVRNFHRSSQHHRIALHTPAGIEAIPAVLEGDTLAEATGSFTIQLTANADALAGVAIVGLDITLDGRRYGEVFDFMVNV